MKNPKGLAVLLASVSLLAITGACSHQQHRESRNSASSHLLTNRNPSAKAGERALPTPADSDALSPATSGVKKAERLPTPETTSNADGSAAAGLASAPKPAAGTWEFMGDENGITTHRRHIEGSSLVEFKGETIMDATIPKILSVLSDTSRKGEWVDRLHTAKDLRQISHYERIEYNRTKAPWPVQDRDFVFKANVTVDAKAKMVTVALRSIEDAAMPEQDCCVRADLKRSTYVLEALDGGRRTRVTVQINADPKGSVPTWIVNLIQRSWPRKTLQALAAQTGKADVAEHPAYRAIFDQAFAASL